MFPSFSKKDAIIPIILTSQGGAFIIGWDGFVYIVWLRWLYLEESSFVLTQQSLPDEIKDLSLTYQRNRKKFVMFIHCLTHILYLILMYFAFLS